MTFEEMDLIIQKMVVSQREFQEEVRTIVRTNDRTIQVILDQAATDRLRRDEERIEHAQRIQLHEQRIQLLEANNQILANTQQGIATLLGSLDEDRPTILRKLNTIEQNTDTILNRLQN